MQTYGGVLSKINGLALRYPRIREERLAAVQAAEAWEWRPQENLELPIPRCKLRVRRYRRKRPVIVAQTVTSGRRLQLTIRGRTNREFLANLQVVKLPTQAPLTHIRPSGVLLVPHTLPVDRL